MARAARSIGTAPLGCTWVESAFDFELGGYGHPADPDAAFTYSGPLPAEEVLAVIGAPWCAVRPAASARTPDLRRGFKQHGPVAAKRTVRRLAAELEEYYGSRG